MRAAAVTSALIVLGLATGVAVRDLHPWDGQSFNPRLAVVPTLREWHPGAGQFDLRSGARILVDPVDAKSLEPTADAISEDLVSLSGKRFTVVEGVRGGPGDIVLHTDSTDEQLAAEGYTLDIRSVVTIRAATPAGVFYGSRSLLQLLLAAHSLSLPQGFARDYPSYHERGFFLDVSTRFASIDLLKRYVRYLSWYKINDFQLGLNDNGGFRLNSPAFPGLAATDGSYSELQFRQLEAYGLARGVTITPEIDSPGHADSLTRYRPGLATPGHPNWLNLAKPESSSFLAALWEAFLPWFTAPTVAIGADEYDRGDSENYRRYLNFIDTVIRQHGKSVRMWASLSGEGGSTPVRTDIQLQQWASDWSDPQAMADLGFPIINASSEFLYIVVPKTPWFETRIDSRELYEHWTPEVFSRSNQASKLPAGDPRLLGAMFSFWGDPTTADTADRVSAAAPVFGEKLWNDVSARVTDETFRAALAQVDDRKMKV